MAAPTSSATAQHVEPQAGFLTTAWLRLSVVSITDIDGQPPTSSLLPRYLCHTSSCYNFANSIRSRRVITPCKCIDGSSTPGPTAIAAANFAMTGSIFMHWTIPLVLYASTFCIPVQTLLRDKMRLPVALTGQGLTWLPYF